MKFITLPSHDIASFWVTEEKAIFTFKTEVGEFQFLACNKEILSTMNVHENLDVDFQYTLTITNKKTKA